MLRCIRTYIHIISKRLASSNSYSSKRIVERLSGVVKFFDKKRGFGFIIPDNEKGKKQISYNIYIIMFNHMNIIHLV